MKHEARPELTPNSKGEAQCVSERNADQTKEKIQMKILKGAEKWKKKIGLKDWFIILSSLLRIIESL